MSSTEHQVLQVQWIYTTSARQVAQITINALSASRIRCSMILLQILNQLSAGDSEDSMNIDRKLIGVLWVVGAINCTTDVYAHC
ncbi:hypothetical protein MLPF_3364 [Mycobacterium lepromatosis]|nr:hypothetical protein MLPF_3364 [Mycobacterium lepromatosis]